MKKIWVSAGRIFLIAVIIIGMLTASGCWGSKQAVYNYVLENKAALEAFAIKFAEESAPLEYDAETTYEDWKVCYWRATGLVEFTSKNRPFAEEATADGFYYSPEDVPACPRIADAVLYEKEGYGWTWTDENSGSWEHTDQITEKWYWFESSFLPSL